MTPDYDVIIVGAGPAGMASAITARQSNLSVLVLDDQPDHGGQVWRNIRQNQQHHQMRAFLGKDYWKGHQLTKDFLNSGSDITHQAVVWQISHPLSLSVTIAGIAQSLTARAIILATGAYERPVPLPGWHLPGVMTVGAAQTLLKASSSGADGAVFVGTGPLFYLTITQYLDAGFSIAGVCDTGARLNSLSTLAALPLALTQPNMLRKGLSWLRRIKAETPYYAHVSDIRLEGKEQVEAVAFAYGKGKTKENMHIPSSHVFLHQGVIPNVNLSMASGLAHQWHHRQMCWHPVCDRHGASSVEGIYIAGDAGGIAGAGAAVASGHITGAAVAKALTRATSPKRALWQHRIKRLHHRALRPFLDQFYAPLPETLIPRDENTIICRCEGLTQAEVTTAIGMGVAGPNQLKAYCRAGMGRCQGRMCGLTVQALLADHHKTPIQDMPYYRLRPPVRPVTIAELAALHQADHDISG
ncbi:MAG: FAD-dependent oxidoreductase [Proteobacteria bacterium]|nr:FAD-dependent oxidoreductase [Pseudomonadota bacterium]